MFEVAGVQRRLIADMSGLHFRSIALGQTLDETTWGYPTREGLETLVETEQVTRLGPVRQT